MNNDRLRPNITYLQSHSVYTKVNAGFAESQFTNLFKDKSFVDDLNRKRGIVSVRVVFVLRSTEIKPSFCRFVIASSCDVPHAQRDELMQINSHFSHNTTSI